MLMTLSGHSYAEYFFLDPKGDNKDVYENIETS